METNEVAVGRTWEEAGFTLRYLKFKGNNSGLSDRNAQLEPRECKAWAQTWKRGILRIPLGRSGG